MRRLTLPPIVFATIVASAAFVSRWSGLNCIAAISIFVGAWLVNGLVATVEDDVPGGFDNPDGTATSPYVVVLKWLARGLVMAAVRATAFGATSLQEPTHG